MKKKKVVIVGAGVSGMILARELMKDPRFEVALIDKEKYPGGWVRTLHTDGGIFEIGPRAIRLSGEGGRCLYTLIKELKLHHELIKSAPSASLRHVFMNGRLEEVSNKPWRWPLSKATRSLIFSLLQEPFKKTASLSDMTLEQFFTSRLGAKTYACLIEPAILGIFGVPGKLLSAKTCAPELWKWIQEKGSLTLGGLWSYAKKEPSLYEEIPQDLAGSSLVSFRLGLCQLIEALAHELKSRIHFNEALKTLTWVPSKQKFHIKSSQLNLEADWVVLACSPWQLKEALHDLPAPWPQFQAAVGSQSLVLVSLAYSQAIDPSLGFGYLVPSSQREHVLGCVVDSNVFPEHNRGYPTRLTVMMDGSYLSGGFHRDQCLQLAQMALARHLKWHHHPKWQALSLAQDALPICRVGHLERLEVLRHTLQSRKMGLYFTGLGYGAQSLSQCALQAHSLARELQNDLESF